LPGETSGSLRRISENRKKSCVSRTSGSKRASAEQRKADLEQKLQELDNQRRALEGDIGRTLKKEDEIKTTLQKSRDALARALTEIKPGVEPSPKQFAGVVQL
jgi:predicted  nucleic acid-binding Zn-ribbon protein